MEHQLGSIIKVKMVKKLTGNVELQKDNGKVVELSSLDVKYFIMKNEMAIIDFYSETCPPCKRMQPFIEELANEFNGKVAFAKLDAKQDPDAQKKFQIQAFPTFYFFYRGLPIAFFIGEKKKQDFVQLMKIHYKTLLGS
jgi:thioredoxin 1